MDQSIRQNNDVNVQCRVRGRTAPATVWMQSLQGAIHKFITL